MAKRAAADENGGRMISRGGGRLAGEEAQQREAERAIMLNEARLGFGGGWK